jgi:hypothetical protein
MIVPPVLRQYEAWSLVLREDHAVRAPENRALMGIYGLKKDEATQQ